VAVALAGASSVFGVGGEAGEKTIVGALRSATAVALYACLFLFFVRFLREGQTTSLMWLVLGAALALVLTRLRVRDPGDLRATRE
jgi:hypothetical protein